MADLLHMEPQLNPQRSLTLVPTPIQHTIEDSGYSTPEIYVRALDAKLPCPLHVQFERVGVCPTHREEDDRNSPCCTVLVGTEWILGRRKQIFDIVTAIEESKRG